MPTYGAKVTADGLIPVPPELKDRLDIKPGTEVEFFVTLDGQVHFHVLTDSFSGSGLQQKNPPLSIREMDDAIGDHLAEKHAGRPAARKNSKSAAE